MDCTFDSERRRSCRFSLMRTRYALAAVVDTFPPAGSTNKSRQVASCLATATGESGIRTRVRLVSYGIILRVLIAWKLMWRIRLIATNNRMNFAPSI